MVQMYKKFPNMTTFPESNFTSKPNSEATLNSQIFTIVQPIALQQIKKYVFLNDTELDILYFYTLKSKQT